MVQEVKLPKVPGYVETVVGGRHVYRNIETGEITDNPVIPEPRNEWIAARDYEPGELLTIEETLYKVLLPVFTAAPFTVGTNVEATTVEAEIANLNKEES